MGIRADKLTVPSPGKRWTYGALEVVLEYHRLQLVRASPLQRPRVFRQTGQAEERRWPGQMEVALLPGVRQRVPRHGPGLLDLAVIVAEPLPGRRNLGLKLHMGVLAT